MTLTKDLYEKGTQILATSNCSWIISYEEKLKKFNLNRLNIENVGLIEPIYIEEYDNCIMNLLDSVQIFTLNTISLISTKEYETDRVRIFVHFLHTLFRCVIVY